VQGRLSDAREQIAALNETIAKLHKENAALKEEINVRSCCPVLPWLTNRGFR